MSRAHAQTTLPGWYVISLRPQGGHGSLRRAAARRGARCIAVSTLALAPLAAGEALVRALQAPLVIATSPAAVRHAARQQPLRALPGQSWLAVGAGTARALSAAGIAEVRWPQRQDSEGLLALPELQAVAGRAIGLLTAPGGRGLIARRLHERGAQMLPAEVYQRRPLRLAPARRRLLQSLPTPCALLVSSGEAFAALWSQLDAAGQQGLRRCQAVASSPRLRELLQRHGFEQVRLAAGAQPARLLAALADIGSAGLPVGCERVATTP